MKRRCCDDASVDYPFDSCSYIFASIVNSEEGLLFSKGVGMKNESTYVEFDENAVLEGNMESKQLIQVGLDCSRNIQHQQVLDLSDDGERWEGDICEDKPYGWGVLYNSDGEKVYEGFRMGDVNVCHGRSYYPDIQKVEYEGFICCGERWGDGVQYSRNGDVVYRGNWLMNDHCIVNKVTITRKNQSRIVLHNRVTELRIESDSFCDLEWDSLDFHMLPNLHVLQIGKGCCGNVNRVEVADMPELETFVVCRDAFVGSVFDWGVEEESSFCVRDCPRLQSIRIERYAFSSFSTCQIKNLPILEVLEMGDVEKESDCFHDASLQLADLPMLKSIVVGRECFRDCTRVVMENLPELTSIECGYAAFCFCSSDVSTLVLRNLPKLASLRGRSLVFYSPRHIILEDLPRLSVVSLNDAFVEYDELKRRNAGALQNHPSFPAFQCECNVFSAADLPSLSHSVTNITIDHGYGNSEDVSELDLSAFSNAVTVEIGFHSLLFVKVVKMVGMRCLKEVRVGRNCFSKQRGVFCLKGCEALAKLTILDHAFSDFESCEMSNLPSLASIDIGKFCFGYTHALALNGFRSLQTLFIGNYSFAKASDPTAREVQGSFSLCHVPSLRSLHIGSFSFTCFNKCVIEDAPALEWIEMGRKRHDSGCFLFADLELKDFPKLKTLWFGRSAFSNCSRVVFENLPELVSIFVGWNAFAFSDDTRSCLIMRNLPKLASFTTDKEAYWSTSFQYPRRVEMENIPSLNTITLLNYAFEHKEGIHTCNVSDTLSSFLK